MILNFIYLFLVQFLQLIIMIRLPFGFENEAMIYYEQNKLHKNI